jgi:transcriptional regulator with XRE-family HTH domain
MNYTYNLAPLYTYLRRTRQSQADLCQQLGISVACLGRYLNGKRLPDLDTLLHICNTLRVSVSTFVHTDAISEPELVIVAKEDFTPIEVKRNAIVEYAKAQGKDQKTIATEVRTYTGKSIPSSTYTRFKVGEAVRMDTLVGFLSTYNLPLDTLFDDKNAADSDDKVLISRHNLLVAKMQLNQLRNENAALHEKIRRLESRAERDEPKKETPKEMTIDTSISPTREAKLRRCIEKLKKDIKDLERALNEPM